MKKLCLILAFMMVFSSFPLLSADGDDPSYWAEDTVNEIKRLGIVDAAFMHGYQDYMNREDFAYLAIIIYEGITGKKTVPDKNKFSDSDNEYVLRAKNAGIVAGYPNGTYEPKKSMTRAEIAKLFVNVLNQADTNMAVKSLKVFNDDCDIPMWAKESVYTAKAFNIVEGVGANNFEPDSLATREQAFIMFYRIYQKYVAGESASAYNNKAAYGLNTSLSLKTLDNKTVNMADYSGKPLMIMFLTAYDKVSKELLNDFETKPLDDGKVNVVYVFNSDKITLNNIKDLTGGGKLKHKIVIDEKAELADYYSIGKRPSTVFINAEGEVTETVLGQFDRSTVDSLLGSR